MPEESKNPMMERFISKLIEQLGLNGLTRLMRGRRPRRTKAIAVNYRDRDSPCHILFGNRNSGNHKGDDWIYNYDATYKLTLYADLSLDDALSQESSLRKSALDEQEVSPANAKKLDFWGNIVWCVLGMNIRNEAPPPDSGPSADCRFSAIYTSNNQPHRVDASFRSYVLHNRGFNSDAITTILAYHFMNNEYCSFPLIPSCSHCNGFFQNLGMRLNDLEVTKISRETGEDVSAEHMMGTTKSKEVYAQLIQFNPERRFADELPHYLDKGFWGTEGYVPDTSMPWTPLTKKIETVIELADVVIKNWLTTYVQHVSILKMKFLKLPLEYYKHYHSTIDRGAPMEVARTSTLYCGMR